MSDFGDVTPDDVFTEGDEDVDWSQVDSLDSQIEYIESIEDDGDRLEEAVLWARELDS